MFPAVLDSDGESVQRVLADRPQQRDLPREINGSRWWARSLRWASSSSPHLSLRLPVGLPPLRLLHATSRKFYLLF